MSVHISSNELTMPHSVDSVYQCGEVNKKQITAYPKNISTPAPGAFISTKKPFKVPSKPQHITPNPRRLNHFTPGNLDTNEMKFQTKLPQFLTPGGPTPSTSTDKFRIKLITPMEIEKDNKVDKISQEKKKSGETIDNNKETK